MKKRDHRCSNIKIPFYYFRDSQYKEKQSYLYNRMLIHGKTGSLYTEMRHHSCPSASEVTLKDMGTNMSYVHKYVHSSRDVLYPLLHDDVTRWKHLLRYWPFVRGIHRSPVNSPHKGQWCGALIFSLICAWINDWVNNDKAGDLRCYHTHYDIVMNICMLVISNAALFK